MRRFPRAARTLLWVSLALLACQDTERPREHLPEPPAPAKATAEDRFHELLSKPAAGTGVPTAFPPAVASNNGASFALWRGFAEKQNFVVSPHSIRAALGLLYLASAPGNWRGHLQSSTRYPRHGYIDSRLDDWQLWRAAAELRFESANALWIARPLALSRAYLDAVSRFLPAEVHSIDFGAGPQRAQQTINAWVSDRTRGRIPEILPGEALDRSTQAVLTNAVSFFNGWRSPFHTEATAPAPFRTPGGRVVKVDMMVGAECQAVFGDAYQAAYADYGASTSVVFTVVVPKRWRGFQWDATTFRRVWAALKDSEDAAFELPKFRLRSRRLLDDVLRELTIDRGDPRLGPLASNEEIRIDVAVHEAFIQVDETSTEAAAATAITEEAEMALEPPPVFRVDRPFYFLLVERRTGLILFMGQVTDPTAAG